MIGFIQPISILNDNVPNDFIEANGTFKGYLYDYKIKDNKILFFVCRGKIQYQPSEEEVNIWINYFGNPIDYFNEIINFENENTTDNTI
jgi:hypothetical protein